MSDRRLIVSADDFGVAECVNEAIETSHRQGVLTAASLMVGAPAAADAVRRAKAMPSLRVGMHLVLVDGRPSMPPDSVRELVDTDGRFRDDMARAGATMFFVPAARRQLALEIEAQFAAFAETGLPLDHVNAHKHFHLHPTIASLILRIGRRYGLKAVRFPIEPIAVLRQVEPGSEPRAEPVVDLWAGLARGRFRRAGIVTPDQVFGLRWSGAMTTPRLRGLIENLPPGLSEIYLHPATHGSFKGSASGYQYQDEYAALTAPEVISAAGQTGISLGGFTDFLV